MQEKFGVVVQEYRASVVWVDSRLNSLGCGATLVFDIEVSILLQNFIGTIVRINNPNQTAPIRLFLLNLRET